MQHPFCPANQTEYTLYTRLDPLPFCKSQSSTRLVREAGHTAGYDDFFS